MTRRAIRIAILVPVRRRLSIAIAAVAVAIACAACGQSSSGTGSAGSAGSSGSATVTGTDAGARVTRSTPGVHRAHPQAIEPVAGAGAGSGSGSGTGSTPRTATVSVSSGSGGLPEPQSEAAIRRELARSGMSASPTQATLTSDGLAVAPIGAPAAVQEVIAAGNQIAHLPYVWGGGHMTYEDTGYDCSGSLSYVFAASHLLDSTVTSGQLAHWGRPGPGKWITVFANAGHTFMYVAGLRFDTVALAETGTRWSDRSADEPDLATFSVRHPAGL